MELEHNDSTISDPVRADTIDSIGLATQEDICEALHQVIDPELGIDVIDLGLVYGIELDELHRAIITMTLTTPACPLTELIEDECAAALAGLVDEFRIDWTWKPRWTLDNITPEGRQQLEALGFNLQHLPIGVPSVTSNVDDSVGGVNVRGTTQLDAAAIPDFTEHEAL